MLAAAAIVQTSPRVVLSFPASVHSTPITGRVYVIFASAPKPDPRIAVLAPDVSPPFFGTDVNAWKPGTKAIIGVNADGYPRKSLTSLPAATYYVEGLAAIYTQYHRADGHTIWAPPQWNGQVFTLTPGFLHSAVTKVHFDPQSRKPIALRLDRVVSASDIAGLVSAYGYANDTPWIKHVRIRSAILSKFWGRPFYLGATILLPKGYATHPSVHYPVVYNQGHFYQPVPWDFTTDARTETPKAVAAGKAEGTGTGYEFYQAWSSAYFPRLLMVTWQHPCPFFDDSYAVNSANCGPFGDAIMDELIPYIETHFRVIRSEYARFLEGGSTGGWESLTLQLQHPKFFGGAYVFDPDPIDFRNFQMVNLYEDQNAFFVPSELGGWHRYERPWQRTPQGQVKATNRQVSQYELAMGSHGRSGYQLDGWWAIFDPAGPDGYPKPMWNMRTGAIDASVVRYARAHGYDLSAYAKENWPRIGHDLVGKLHFVVGDMDSYYLNLAVYRMESVLDGLRDPAPEATFTYGRPMKGHGWHPMTWAVLLKMMAGAARAHTPLGHSSASWNY